MTTGGNAREEEICKTDLRRILPDLRRILPDLAPSPSDEIRKDNSGNTEQIEKRFDGTPHHSPRKTERILERRFAKDAKTGEQKQRDSPLTAPVGTGHRRGKRRQLKLFKFREKG